jgi:hypothetical protein
MDPVLSAPKVSNWCGSALSQECTEINAREYPLEKLARSGLFSIRCFDEMEHLGDHAP